MLSWDLPRTVTRTPPLGAMAARQRAAEAERDGARVLPLLGAPVLPMPDHVRRAAAEALDLPDPRDPRGLPELRAAISDDLRAAYGLTVDPERRLIVTHGAMQGLALTFRTVLGPGDEVVIPAPTFFFDALVRRAGAMPVYVPCRERDGWAIDVEAVEAAVTPHTRALVLCNPTNPTGYLPDPATLEALVELAARHGLLVISDDSWQRFTFDGRSYVPAEALTERWPHVITVTSLSKYFAFSLWRVGYVLAAPEVIDALECAFGWESAWCGVVPQRAAVAAIEGPREWLHDALGRYEAKRDLVCDGIVRAGLPAPVRPAAGAFLLADCAALGRDPDTIDRALLEQGIATVRGADMHGPDTHVRIVFGSDDGVLEQLNDRLARAYRSARAGGGA